MNQKQKHFKTCRTFPVLCTNKCGRTDIPREELEAHILDECPATEVQCEYKKLGCEEVFPRSAAKSHSQMQIESHLRLALRVLEATQYQVHELVTVVKEQSQQIEKQSQQIERQSQQIEKLISKNNEQSEKMERPMSTAQEHPLQREGRGFPTPFQWKIDTTEAKSKTLFSEPFYLFEGGYKYIMKISPPPLFERCLRVSIKVVPGEFDDSLSWPCKEKVRVTMLGQRHRSVPLNKTSGVIDFEKVEEPCSRPLHDGHHEYRLILQLSAFAIFVRKCSILLMVSGE